MTAQIAIVTGHSSGLGRCIAQMLLERGWVVVGVSRHPIRDELFASHHHALHNITGSVANETTVAAAFEMADTLGGATLVVNCAGQGAFGEIGSYSIADIMTALEGNLVGLIAFSDRAIVHLRERGGSIVNVMSTASKKYRTAESVYTAAKWGAKAYTRTLRDAIKAKKLNIRVYEIYPCGMNTNFWASAIRAGTDGKNFPEPKSIARVVISAVLSNDTAYPQELTFERA